MSSFGSVKQFDICNFPNASLFIEEALKTGKCLILFDGLDEVKKEGDARQSVIQDIETFSNKHHANTIVITCRIAATEYMFENFNYVEMADFTKDQIETFISKWFANETDLLSNFKEDFYKDEQEGLRELAQSPLLLTLICLAYSETLEFPVRRCDIYDEALEALLKKWDSSRRIRRDEVYKKLSHKRKRQMLSFIAASGFQESKFLIDEKSLADQIIRYLQTLPDPEAPEDIDGLDMIAAIEAQHGVIVTRSKGIFSFSHLTFQEFLTAEYIVQNEARGAVKTLAHQSYTNSQWTEVVLMVAQLISDPSELINEMAKILKKSLTSIASLCQIKKIQDHIHGVTLKKNSAPDTELIWGNKPNTTTRPTKSVVIRGFSERWMLSFMISETFHTEFIREKHGTELMAYLLLALDCVYYSRTNNRSKLYQSLRIFPEKSFQIIE